MFWNEADLGLAHPLNEGLVTIVAFVDGHPMLIGTGFVIQSRGETAVCCTAAHNFSAIRKLQSPNRHHPSALPEFLPSAKPIDLDKTLLRAISVKADRVEFAPFEWAAFDETTDIAAFGLRIQEGGDKDHFSKELLLEPSAPKCGDAVALLSYQALEVVDASISAEKSEFSVRRKLTLRTGHVSEVFPEGHLLCRGPCIATTIPILAGMSGGPVMYYGDATGAMRTFGVLCSDSDDDRSTKLDRSKPGRSIVSLIRPEVRPLVTGQNEVKLRLAAQMAFADGGSKKGTP